MLSRGSFLLEAADPVTGKEEADRCLLRRFAQALRRFLSGCVYSVCKSVVSGLRGIHGGSKVLLDADDGMRA